MATKAFFRDAAAAIDPTANIDKEANFTQGSASVSKVTTCVTGPTSGVQVTDGGGGTPIEWYLGPLSAVTISGTITNNIWATESSTAANVGMQMVIERCDGTGAVVSTISDSEDGSEVTGGLLARNWTATPTSTTLADGDYIRLRPMGNDAGGNMGGSGRNFTIAYGAGAGVSGDSYVQFAEALTLYSAPTGRVQRLSSLGVG